MNNLIPEKRLDKNGVLTTKHVRAVPKASGSLSNVPAPSLGGAVPGQANKGVGKTFKPRPGQTKQQRYSISTTMNPISPELLAGTDWRPASNSYFPFEASEVEVYAVLSVAKPGDAARMLCHGVRTAEEAREYLLKHGAEHQAVKRTKITADALKRGISSYDFMNRMRLVGVAHPDDDSAPYAMDVLELSTISALNGQYGYVVQEVRSGEIKLDDIKYLGVSKLKSFRRLESTKTALLNVHDPDSKYSLDDLKYIVDRAAKESSNAKQYNSALSFLAAEGVQGLKQVESLHLLTSILSKYKYRNDKTPSYLYDSAACASAAYEIEFRTEYVRQQGAAFLSNDDMVMLREAGVPAVVAAQRFNEGMNARSIIAVENGTEKALADGWL